MSVSSIYLAVEWQPFLENAQRPDIETQLDDAQENEEAWIRSFPFGKQADEYLFESRNALSRFDDWFRAVRRQIPAAPGGAVESFRAVFLGFGLMHDDDTLELKPINRLAGPDGEWLIAAMSPEDVRLLRDQAAAINRRELDTWFDAALARKQCDLMKSGESAVVWLDALQAGLDNVVNKHEGVIFGMA